MIHTSPRPSAIEHRRFLIFLLQHLAYGTLGGVIFGLLILVFDIAGLWTMIAASPDRLLALILLFFGLFITFGSIGMAVGIMQLGEDRD